MPCGFLDSIAESRWISDMLTDRSPIVRWFLKIERTMKKESVGRKKERRDTLQGGK